MGDDFALEREAVLPPRVQRSRERGKRVKSLSKGTVRLFLVLVALWVVGISAAILYYQSVLWEVDSVADANNNRIPWDVLEGFVEAERMIPLLQKVGVGG